MELKLNDEEKQALNKSAEAVKQLVSSMKLG
jgi:malate/lactate dehydrogenase